MYDAQLKMLDHGEKLNQTVGGNTIQRVIPQFLKNIYLELQRNNILVQEIETIGNFSINNNVQVNMHTSLVEINTITSHFDVAAISSNDVP